ncbi:MAG TPA: alanine racemase [Burkholderiaceae bacterium]|nr:alanine racemase [Burkholderiaceae bacterium]
MPRPISALIDLAAMRGNLALARRHARGRFVWAVVKANAYGHGLPRAVRGFAEADGLALLDLDEAQRARDCGWTRPILLLEGCFEPRDLQPASALRLTLVVHEIDQIDMLERALLPAPVEVYLKFNTGMNRLGFDARDASAATSAYERLKACANVAQLTLMIHFANADRSAGTSGPIEVAEQLAALQGVSAEWREPRSFANSAALFLRPEVQGDSVRPGIALYGAATDESHTAAQLGVEAAMTLKSRLIAVQTLSRGQAIGYGSRFAATRAMRVGVVACGYADGYPRNAPDGTPVLVDGIRVPIAGRVSMDMITVDLTGAPGTTVGSEVELWGRGLPIDEVANRCGTVGYELMCALAARVPITEVD